MAGVSAFKAGLAASRAGGDCQKPVSQATGKWALLPGGMTALAAGLYGIFGCRAGRDHLFGGTSAGGGLDRVQRRDMDGADGDQLDPPAPITLAASASSRFSRPARPPFPGRRAWRSPALLTSRTMTSWIKGSFSRTASAYGFRRGGQPGGKIGVTGQLAVGVGHRRHQERHIDIGAGLALFGLALPPSFFAPAFFSSAANAAKTGKPGLPQGQDRRFSHAAKWQNKVSEFVKAASPADQCCSRDRKSMASPIGMNS